MTLSKVHRCGEVWRLAASGVRSEKSKRTPPLRTPWLVGGKGFVK